MHSAEHIGQDPFSRIVRILGRTWFRTILSL